MKRVAFKRGLQTGKYDAERFVKVCPDLATGLRELLIYRVAELHDIPHTLRVFSYAYDSRKGVVQIFLPYLPTTLCTVSSPSSERLQKWYGQLTEVLTVLHDLGFIHRDVKPTNVLLDENDNAVLIDFGLSRPTYCSFREAREYAPSSVFLDHSDSFIHLPTECLTTNPEVIVDYYDETMDSHGLGFLLCWHTFLDARPYKSREDLYRLCSEPNDALPDWHSDALQETYRELPSQRVMLRTPGVTPPSLTRLFAPHSSKQTFSGWLHDGVGGHLSACLSLEGAVCSGHNVPKDVLRPLKKVVMFLMTDKGKKKESRS